MVNILFRKEEGGKAVRLNKRRVKMLKEEFMKIVTGRSGSVSKACYLESEGASAFAGQGTSVNPGINRCFGQKCMFLERKIGGVVASSDGVCLAFRRR